LSFRLPDGSVAQTYRLANAKGMGVTITTLGGTILRIDVPDRAGQIGNVNLGPASVEAIFHSDSPYLGAICGRVANRINNGTFQLDGKTVRTSRNNIDKKTGKGVNTIHGGTIGYDRCNWAARTFDKPEGAKLVLTHSDPDGHEGFPGKVGVQVEYTLTDDNILRIVYRASTTKPTPINLTNHAYFNLKDGGKSNVHGHEVKIHAQLYTPSDDEMIPTGAVNPVIGTPMDFTKGKPLGQDIEQIAPPHSGYDHNFIIDGPSGTLRIHAEVYEPVTGRTLECWSTEPAVQLYTGNFLDGTVTSIDGVALQRRAGFCLETQHYPDSVNQPEFPSTILRPGDTYKQTCEYRFGVR
jgi:aldose 1-epimerase